MTIRRIGVGEVAGARQAQVVATDDLIFFSGIHPSDTAGDIGEQARSALSTLDRLLSEVGEDQHAIVMVHIWLKDMRYFGGLNAAWNAWADPDDPPARTCVSGELYRPDLLLELVVTAARTSPGAAR